MKAADTETNRSRRRNRRRDGSSATPTSNTNNTTQIVTNVAAPAAAAAARRMPPGDLADHHERSGREERPCDPVDEAEKRMGAGARDDDRVGMLEAAVAAITKQFEAYRTKHSKQFEALRAELQAEFEVKQREAHDTMRTEADARHAKLQAVVDDLRGAKAAAAGGGAAEGAAAVSTETKAVIGPRIAPCGDCAQEAAEVAAVVAERRVSERRRGELTRREAIAQDALVDMERTLAEHKKAAAAALAAEREASEQALAAEREASAKALAAEREACKEAVDAADAKVALLAKQLADATATAAAGPQPTARQRVDAAYGQLLRGDSGTLTDGAKAAAASALNKKAGANVWDAVYRAAYAREWVEVEALLHVHVTAAAPAAAAVAPAPELSNAEAPIGTVTDEMAVRAMDWAGCYGAPLRVLLWMLAAGVSPTAAVSDGDTALHGAASGGDAQWVTLLIKLGANPDAKRSGDGCTPLHCAAINNKIDPMEALVAAGADVTLRSTGSPPETPMEVARREGHTEFVRRMEAAVAVHRAMRAGR